LDALLGWLMRPDVDAWAPLNVALRACGVSREQAVAQAFALLDACVMDADTETPERVLGLRRDADPEVIKQRYRRLIAVYHPDRHADGGRDLNARTDRINRAYRALQRRQSEPAREWPLWTPSARSRASQSIAAHAPPAVDPQGAGIARQVRARRADLGIAGEASRVQRRLVQAMMAGCALLVVILIVDRATTEFVAVDAQSTDVPQLGLDEGRHAPVEAAAGMSVLADAPSALGAVDAASGHQAAVALLSFKETSGQPSGMEGGPESVSLIGPSGAHAPVEAPVDRVAADALGLAVSPPGPHSGVERDVATASSLLSGPMIGDAAPLGMGSESASPVTGSAASSPTRGQDQTDATAPVASSVARPAQARSSIASTESAGGDPCSGATSVLSELRRAYQGRSADRLARLFTPAGRDRHARGREAIRALYSTWFAETRDQEIRFTALSMRSPGEGRCRVAAQFELSYRDASGRARSQSGGMVVLLARTSGHMLIDELAY
jgi:hypothetical protein